MLQAVLSPTQLHICVINEIDSGWSGVIYKLLGNSNEVEFSHSFPSA